MRHGISSLELCSGELKMRKIEKKTWTILNPSRIIHTAVVVI